MDVDTWATCYDKLTTAYQRKADDDQFKMYFQLFKNVPGPTIRLAVEKAIKEEKFWPNPATLRDYCDGATRDISIPASSCGTCHGSTWVDAAPLQVHGMAYQQVKRCPQCWVLSAAQGTA